MKYLIFLTLLFCNQLQAREEAVFGAIVLKEGDIVIYPSNAEPIEVEAVKNDLTYICTVMPEDAFKISHIFNYPDRTTKMMIKKIYGTPGDQEVCHRNSYISDVIIKTPETIRTKEEETQEFYSPFVVDTAVLKNILRRKNKDKISAAEAVLFKKGSRITYPSDAEPVEIKTHTYNEPCTIAPGDTFKIDLIHQFTHGDNILLTKVNGTPGDQEICHIDKDSVEILIPKCELVKSEEGIPEGVICEVSLQKLFDYVRTQRQEKNKVLIGTALIEEEDIVIYSSNAEPIEVEAVKNDLTYICTVMPEDAFIISHIFSYHDGTTKMMIKKIYGTPGDHEICHRDSYISDVIIKTPETIRTKEEEIHEFYSPFVVDTETIKDIQRRKDKDTISTAEAVFFKTGSRITYPLDAEPVEIKTHTYNVPCTIAPGDTFEINFITNFIHGNSMLLIKVNGTPGDQRICHINRDSVGILIPKCELVKTKKGIPEGVICEVSLQKLFDYIH